MTANNNADLTSPDPVIMIVDDEPDILDVLEHTLRGSGNKVISAKNGTEAYTLIEERSKLFGGNANVKAIVSDWMMAGGDGMKLLADLRRSTHRNVPFVLISGAVTHEQLNMAIQWDADGVLLKPFPSEMLHKVLDEAILRRETKEIRRAGGLTG